MKKSIVSILLLVVVSSLLVITVVYLVGSNRNAGSISASPHPTINVNVSDVPVDAIPAFSGHMWRIASDSNKQFVQCFTAQKIKFAQVRTLNYRNDIPDAQANISWIQGINAPPDYFTLATQHCLAGAGQVSNSIGVNTGNFSDLSALTATNGSNFSYATAVSADNMLVLTFWMQPSAPVMSPSPASVMAARAIALYNVAKMGVRDPKIVSCQYVAQRPKAKVPSELLTLVNAHYAKLAPVTVLGKLTGVVDVSAESTAPHICVYSDGVQVAHSGKIPPAATAAISVAVEHAPDPVTSNVFNTLLLARIPNKGWVTVDEGTSP